MVNRGRPQLGVMGQSSVRWQSLVLAGLDSIKSLSTASRLLRQVAAALVCVLL